MVGLALMAGPAFGQDRSRVDFWPAVMLENAWGMPAGAWWGHTGIELEEDSGDFPTTKAILHFRHGLTERAMMTGTVQLVRYNSDAYTAWGGANTGVGIQYQVYGGQNSSSALQLKGELLAPTGGMGTGHVNFAGGLDASWKRGASGLHFNGHYTWGSVNGKRLDNRVGVSEVDRWRLAAGTNRWLVADRVNFALTLLAAKPIRPKDTELSLELGVRGLLSEHWGLSGGAGAGLRERGQEYIWRFGIDYRK